MSIQNLIVGCGLSGAIIAERLASKGQKVLIIDKRSHVAGNCYDYKDMHTGITVHQYGPHIFHTNNKPVWDYLSRFTQWHYFTLKPNVVIDNIKATLPFNLNTLHEVFPRFLAEKLEQKLIAQYGYNKKVSILELKTAEDPDLAFLAEFVYEKVFKYYTMKQWGLTPEEIDPTVTARVPVLVSRDSGYFQDTYQGIPAKGYTKMVENILAHPNITVQLNTEYAEIQSSAPCDRLFFTGAIDEFFGYTFGELPYRSLHFDIQEKNMEYFQNTVVTNYPNNYDFTRICEHKYFLSEKSDKTIISIEYPQPFVLGQNERYYPIENPANAALYAKYLEEAKKETDVFFLGRLGDYKYYNMDLAVDRALKLAEQM